MEQRYDVEQTIRRAIYVKRRLDHQQLPSQPKDSLGKNVIIPDDERSHEDILEDIEHNKAMEHPEVVEQVFDQWLEILSDREKDIVLLRCRPMGWKRVARVAEKMGVTDRQYSSQQLRRIFNGALDRIAGRFYGN